MKAPAVEGGIEDELEMSSAQHTVTLQNGYLTFGMTSTDTNHEAPPYLMRVVSVVIIVKGLCLWTSVPQQKCAMVNVYHSIDWPLKASE